MAMMRNRAIAAPRRETSRTSRESVRAMIRGNTTGYRYAGAEWRYPGNTLEACYAPRYGCPRPAVRKVSSFGAPAAQQSASLPSITTAGTRATPYLLALAAPPASFMETISTSHEEQAIRLTMATVSSHSGHPAVKTSIFLLAAIVNLLWPGPVARYRVKSNLLMGPQSCTHIADAEEPVFSVTPRASPLPKVSAALRSASDNQKSRRASSAPEVAMMRMRVSVRTLNRSTRMPGSTLVAVA